MTVALFVPHGVQRFMPYEYSDILAWLNKKADELGKEELRKRLGIAGEKSIYRYLNRSSLPKADAFCRWLNILGAQILLPEDIDQQTRNQSLQVEPGDKALSHMSQPELAAFFGGIVSKLSGGQYTARVRLEDWEPDHPPMILKLTIEPCQDQNRQGSGNDADECSVPAENFDQRKWC